MSGNVTKVGVVGAAGKMGKTLIELIQASDDLSLAAAIEQPGVPAIGSDAGELAGVGNAGHPGDRKFEALRHGGRHCARQDHGRNLCRSHHQ